MHRSIGVANLLVVCLLCTTVLAEDLAMLLAPTLGRPVAATPGQPLTIRIAGAQHQAITSAELISRSEPPFAQPLVLGSGEQTALDEDGAVMAVVPRGTPRQAYDLRLVVGGQSLTAHHAVMVSDPQATHFRIAQIREVISDADTGGLLTPSKFAELDAWDVDLIVICAVRLDHEPAGWNELLRSIAGVRSAVLMAPGEGVDLGAFGTFVSPGLTSIYQGGGLRAASAISTRQRPLNADPEQAAWLSRWLAEAPQSTSIVVMDHGVAEQALDTGTAPLILSADDPDWQGDYRIIELRPDSRRQDRPAAHAHSWGTLLSEQLARPDVASGAVQLILHNRSDIPLENAHQRIVLPSSANHQPWTLGGTIAQALTIEDRLVIDWVGQVPAAGVTSVILGCGQQPDVPAITASFELRSLVVEQRPGSSWGWITLHNRSASQATLRPLVTLGDQQVPYRIQGLRQTMQGNFRFRIESQQQVQLELLVPETRPQPGQHELKLHLTELPAWRTLSQPIRVR
jgi:hypothetical protein